MNQEIKVRKLFVTIYKDSRTGDVGSSNIEVGDLFMVKSGESHFGVVVKVNPGSVELIDNYNQRHVVPMGSLGQKLSRKRQLTNRHGQMIMPKSTVKLIDGPYKDTIAHVLAVHDQIIFVKINQTNQIVSVLNDHCFLLQSSENTNVLRQAKFFKQNNQAQETPLGNSLRLNTHLIGQRKKVLSGQYKGYEGIIKSLNDSSIRFELSAINRTVNLTYDCLGLRRSIAPNPQSNLIKDNASRMASPHRALATPMHDPFK